METKEKDVEQVFVSQVQAAKILDIKPRTIKLWRKRYEDFPKPYVVSGNAIFFKKDEIIEWMERRRKDA